MFNNDKVSAYADIWNLNESFYTGLKFGLNLEEEINSSKLSNTKFFYIGSIITNPDDRKDGKKTNKMPILADAFQQYLLKKFLENGEITVLGVGSSSIGKRILSSWGFLPVIKDENAIDLRQRYELHIKSIEDVKKIKW